MRGDVTHYFFWLDAAVVSLSLCWLPSKSTIYWVPLGGTVGCYCYYSTMLH